MSEAKKGGFSLSSQIAIALGLGVALSIFLGERAGVLSVVADGYMKLLQPLFGTLAASSASRS